MSQTPYLGSKISLISKLDIRYEGILYTVDSNESTIALAKVRSFGTENRPTDHPVKARDDVYEFIIFKASDIKDLVVCETPREPEGLGGLDYDPAIVSVQAAPTEPAVPSKGASASGEVAQGENVAPKGLLPPHNKKQDGGRGPGKPNNSRQQGGGHNRGGGGRFNRNMAPKEKLKFDSDYDFETANEKFKEQLDTLSYDLNNKIVFDADVEENPKKNEEDNKDCYDKKSSFFDSISCESSEKAEGMHKRPDWRKERQTNQETFGQYTLRSQFHGRNGYRGGNRYYNGPQNRNRPHRNFNNQPQQSSQQQNNRT